MRSPLLLTAFLFLFAATGLAQDPVQVDPKHYQVVLENDQVRVLRITYAPGEKSVMHKHPEGVAVFLSEHRVRFGLPGGKSEERAGTRGQTLWSPAETHLPENISSAPLELILVELKGKKSSGGAVAASEDPVKVASNHCTVDFENDQVRVLRWKVPAGEKTAMHAHPDSVAIPLTELRGRYTYPDGTTEVATVRAGEVRWSGARKHIGENTSSQPVEIIEIELKR